ncbi:hypothetical protein Patl1_02646 [Pistacia atlantica]|uniref:Uncharacterized protein n=1 Tax=Pistacia atlantica TaxID=434234 RepID=A0ACC1CCH4_9ROSI|nr:hypothetical protein Patl1_02646 [Pistacia atlantica]
MADYDDLNNDDLIVYAIICVHHIHMMFLLLVGCVLAQQPTARTTSRLSRINRAIRLQSERIRDEIMQRIAGPSGRHLIRMGPSTFVEFCRILATEGGLRSTQRATIEEQVAKFLWIIGQDTRHNACSLLFHRFGETVSRHFHKVLEAIIELEDKYLLQPNRLQVPLEIQNHSRLYPYFKEYSQRNPPRNARELFNHRHSSLRNAIERAFGVLKKLHNFLMGVDPDEGLIAEVDVEIAREPIEHTNHALNLDNHEDARKGELIRDSIANAMKVMPHKVKKESNMRWTQSMDDILIDAYLHEHVQGNRDGLSGFAYDKTTSTWHAEPKVWDKLIESNPSAVEWRSKPVYNYDKLCELFAKDRANGEDGDTPREMKRKRAHLSQNNVECPTSVEDIDKMVAQNQASLNAVNVEGSENDLTSPGCQSEVSSRKLKNRCRVKEDNNPINEAISAMDRATQYLGDVLLLCANKSSSKDNELLEHLVEIGIEDDDELLRAQTFLLENPTKLRVFYSFPAHHHKSILMKMLENEAT